VKAGDTVDFVVDCRSGDGFDSYNWSPRIEYQGGQEGMLEGRVWNASNDFAAPGKTSMPLDAWEQFAQVLLLSNELAFVD
jgi:hypothetical protein